MGKFFIYSKFTSLDYKKNIYHYYNEKFIYYFNNNYRISRSDIYKKIYLSYEYGKFY